MKKTKIYDGKILGLNVYDLTIRGRKVKSEIIEDGFSRPSIGPFEIP